MITESMVRTVHLPPEVIPDTWYGNIAAGMEVTPPVFDVKRFQPLVAHLRDIAVDQDDQVEVRIRTDKITPPAVVAGSLRNLAANPFDILGTSYTWWNLWSSAVKANYRAFYGLLVYPPTVAHKLKYGLSLTPDEQRIDRELGISGSVEKGILPLPFSSIVQREYQVVHQEPLGRILTIGAAVTVIDTLHPAPGEFLVLTGIAADPGAAGDVVTITIDRDDDANFIPQLRTFPLSLAADIACFIPALKELRLTVVATGAVANWNVRYNFLRCKMTNLLRVRFGLVSKDELPEASLWDKVKGGVL